MANFDRDRFADLLADPNLNIEAADKVSYRHTKLILSLISVHCSVCISSSSLCVIKVCRRHNIRPCKFRYLCFGPSLCVALQPHGHDDLLNFE